MSMTTSYRPRRLPSTAHHHHRNLFAAGTTDPTSGGMAPDPTATSNTLTDGYNAQNTVTVYCHTLQNIQLNWNSANGPVPSWFTTLSQALTVAQAHAATWVTTLGPEIFSTIPQSLINYGNTFNQATNDIINIINGVTPTNPLTSAQQTQITQLLQAVLDQLNSETTTLADVTTSLQQFSTDVQNDNTAFQSGQLSAQQAVGLEQSQIASIQAQINLVQTEIAQDSKLALASEIGIGVSIFMVVAGVALTIATDGAAAPLLLAGVGVLATGAAIAGTIIYSPKVQSDLNQLYTLQSELTSDQQQVAALNGIISSLGALITANEAATQALSSIMNMWSVLSGKLASTITDIQNASTAQVGSILQELDLQAAQTAWTQLTQFCTSMQTNPVTVQTPLTQPTSSTMAMITPRRAQARRPAARR
jgi:Bacillus haemolytic enterotoxin (HBL)